MAEIKVEDRGNRGGAPRGGRFNPLWLLPLLLIPILFFLLRGRGNHDDARPVATDTVVIPVATPTQTDTAPAGVTPVPATTDNATAGPGTAGGDSTSGGAGAGPASAGAGTGASSDTLVKTDSVRK